MIPRLVFVSVLCATGACVPHVSGRAGESARGDLPALRPSLDTARQLDQEGVRLFRLGRFTDAISYFRAAFRLGGPASELWNIVRCREGMDDAEGAANAIDDYLATKDLPPQDRTDAAREAQSLRSRVSILTVTTSPPGAAVTIDGKPTPAPTPSSVALRPGAHSIAIRREGYAPVMQTVEARYGRAIVVSLDLERTVKYKAD